MKESCNENSEWNNYRLKNPDTQLNETAFLLISDQIKSDIESINEVLANNLELERRYLEAIFSYSPKLIKLLILDPLSKKAENPDFINLSAVVSAITRLHECISSSGAVCKIFALDMIMTIPEKDSMAYKLLLNEISECAKFQVKKSINLIEGKLQNRPSWHK